MVFNLIYAGMLTHLGTLPKMEFHSTSREPVVIQEVPLAALNGKKIVYTGSLNKDLQAAANYMEGIITESVKEIGKPGIVGELRFPELQ